MQQSGDSQLDSTPEFSNWSDAKTQRQIDYEQLKEELQISDDHLKKLRVEQSDASHAFEEVCAGTNVSHCILLRKKLMRIERELNYEENVNQHIKQLLDQASYEKTVEQINAAKMGNTPKRTVNNQLEVDRINQEIKFTQQTKAMIASVQRECNVKGESDKCYLGGKSLNTNKSQLKHKQFLNKTMRDLQTQKEARRQEEMLVHEKMFSSTINLKNSIEKSKDSIAARRARQLSELSAMRKEENALRMKATSSSLDVDEEVALNRRMAQIDARHRAFREAQSRRRLEIVAKLLEEEHAQKQKRKTMVYLFERDRANTFEKFSTHEKTSNWEKEMSMNILKGKSPRKIQSSAVNQVKELVFSSSEDSDPADEKQTRNNSTIKSATQTSSQEPAVETILPEDVDNIVGSFSKYL
ncbi:hypothetical protein EG68_10194 [Paragonimus skrjabini miyazakii]|uniref:Uncharacterized protein n=1 Tax=Paragonimus skrjabini miyazakii TaxID=59628 RepID=A0A8S9YGD3_9TREM|nr:hypothetical protein EG68_10194 [Paragonimus skrjabini miyazakii]